MLSGVRTIELRAAEWAEFDLDKALWEIPKEQLKKTPPASCTAIYPGNRHAKKLRVIIGHGFNHIMSTILHEHGFESVWIEMQLEHVNKNSIRGTYNHAQYILSRKEMLQWYAKKVFE